MVRWCEDSRVRSLVGGAGSEGCVRSWTTINQLVNLPHDYSELINTVSQFPCPASSGDDSRTPTMCLVCGKMLCSQVGSDHVYLFIFLWFVLWIINIRTFLYQKMMIFLRMCVVTEADLILQLQRKM